jgi:hypothetical protein
MPRLRPPAINQILIKTVVAAPRLVSGFSYPRGVNREANMRPYFVWLVSLAAGLVASIDPAGVSAAFIGGRPLSVSHPAPRPQMVPFAGHPRWWRWRLRGFAGGVWPGGSSYGYGPSGDSYGYGYPDREIYVDLPGPGYYPYGRPDPEPIYEAAPYRVAPSAKIIHLTPRE